MRMLCLLWLCLAGASTAMLVACQSGADSGEVPTPAAGLVLQLEIGADAPPAVRAFADRLRKASKSLSLYGYRITDEQTFAQMAVLSYHKRSLAAEEEAARKYYIQRGIGADKLAIPSACEAVQQWLDSVIFTIEAEERRRAAQEELRLVIEGPSEEDVISIEKALLAWHHRAPLTPVQWEAAVQEYVEQGRLSGPVSPEQVRKDVLGHLAREWQGLPAGARAAFARSWEAEFGIRQHELLERSPAVGRKKPFDEMLQEYLQADATSEQRGTWEALRAVPLTPDEVNRIAARFETLERPAQQVRLLNLLRHDRSERGNALLTRVLETERDPDVLQAALEGFSRRRELPMHPIQTMEKLLEHTADRAVRQTAMGLLMSAYRHRRTEWGPDFLGLIRRLIESKVPEDRVLGVRLWLGEGHVGPWPLDPATALRAVREEPHQRTKVAMIAAIGQWSSSPGVLDTLLAMLDADNPEAVRLAAAMHTRIPSETVLGKLIPFVAADPSEDVRKALQRNIDAYVRGEREREVRRQEHLDRSSPSHVVLERLLAAQRRVAEAEAEGRALTASERRQIAGLLEMAARVLEPSAPFPIPDGRRQEIDRLSAALRATLTSGGQPEGGDPSE